MTPSLAQAIDRIAVLSSVRRTRTEAVARSANHGDPREIAARIRTVVAGLDKLARDLEQALGEAHA